MFDIHFQIIESKTLKEFESSINIGEFRFDPDKLPVRNYKSEYTTGCMIDILLKDFCKATNIEIQEAYSLLYKQAEKHLLSQFSPQLSWHDRPQSSKSKLAWLKELGIIDQVEILAEQLFRAEADRFTEAEIAKRGIVFEMPED